MELPEPLVTHETETHYNIALDWDALKVRKKAGTRHQPTCPSLLAEERGTDISEDLVHYEEDRGNVSREEAQYPAHPVFFGSLQRRFPQGVLQIFSDIERVDPYQKSEAQIERRRTAILVLLHDLREAWERDQARLANETQVPVVVPMKKIHRGEWLTDVNEGPKYTATQAAIQKLIDAGLIERVRGIRKEYAPLCWQRRMRDDEDFATELFFTAKFEERMEELERWRLEDPDRLEDTPAFVRSPVVVKDEDKNAVPVAELPENEQKEVLDSEAFLAEQNDAWQDLDVTVHVPVIIAKEIRHEEAPASLVERIRWKMLRAGFSWDSRVEGFGRDQHVIFEVPASALRCRRVFNRSTTQMGGRWYSRIQNMPSIFRPFVRVNGKETATLDFDNLHPRMLYDLRIRRRFEEEGILPEEEDRLRGDAYDIAEQLADQFPVPKIELRKAVKLMLNALINCRNAQQATMLFRKKDWSTVLESAVWSALLNHEKWNRLLIPEIRKALKAKHEHVDFSSDAGLRLQKIDSEIVRYIVENAESPVLPVHDGFVFVDAKEGQALMQEAYSKVVYGRLPGFYQEEIGVSREWKSLDAETILSDPELCPTGWTSGEQHDKMTAFERDLDVSRVVEAQGRLQGMQKIQELRERDPFEGVKGVCEEVLNRVQVRLGGFVGLDESVGELVCPSAHSSLPVRENLLTNWVIRPCDKRIQNLSEWVDKLWDRFANAALAV